jgi:signal peptidase
MNKLKKFYVILTNTVLVILIIIGMLVGITLLPFKENFKLLVVMSGSMAPTISTGSVIVIKPAMEYKIDDIVTFKSYNSQKKNDYTTHRIVSVERNKGGNIYHTKGDANESQDSGTLSKDQIKGKVLFSIALIGYIVGYAKTLPGLIVIIVLATVIAYEELKKIRDEIGNMRRGKKSEKKKSNNKKDKKEDKRKVGKDDKKD